VRWLLPVLLLALAGCLPGLQAAPVQRLHNLELTADTVWQGRILIDGQVKVFKGATLTIRPGTEIAFVRQDLDQDGLGDGTLVVEGNLVAVGRRDAPIRFVSAAADPQPGDWLEIRVDFAREVHLRYCEIRHSAYTLHAHFTRGVVEDCTIRDNIDGCRLGQASFAFHHNLIAHNQGKGINFRNSRVELHHNLIHHNGSGIFLFESDREFSIHDNNLYANDFNFRLGDFYQTDVTLIGNWWGSSDPGTIAAGIYDRRQDPTIGRVSTAPAAAWIDDCGPRDALAVTQTWSLETGGFLDAPALVAGETLLVAGWDGKLRALDAGGQLRWQAEIGDVADAGLASDGERVFVQAWNRQVQAYRLADGTPLWNFSYPESSDDDHRQGGLVIAGGRLLVPAWNGNLYALDPATGALLWQVDCGQPLRAAPLVTGGLIVQASGSGRLTALADDGRRLWQRQLGAPLLNTPAVFGGLLGVLTRDGLLLALESATGVERWRQPLAGPVYYSAPLAGSDALYVATAAGRLYRLDAAGGAIVWQRELPGPSYAPPVLADGRLLIGDNSGVLSVVAAEGGSLLGSFSAGGPIQTAPVAFAGQLVFGARDRQLHALQLVPAP